MAPELGECPSAFMDAQGRSWSVTLKNGPIWGTVGWDTAVGGSDVARAPRGKRVLDPSDGSFVVVNRAPRGQPDPYFDTSRNVWVAPWRKADGRLGKPTGRTRAAAEASRNRHIADEAANAKLGPLADGFHAGTTLAELGRWWLDHVAVHRVRVTTWSTYDKQLRLVGARLGNVPVRKLRADQVATMVSELAKSGSASRARNVRALLAQVLDEALNLGLADDNVAKRVRSPRVACWRQPQEEVRRESQKDSCRSLPGRRSSAVHARGRIGRTSYAGA